VAPRTRGNGNADSPDSVWTIAEPSRPLDFPDGV
jgi:hypothetical protein